MSPAADHAALLTGSPQDAPAGHNPQQPPALPLSRRLWLSRRLRLSTRPGLSRRPRLSRRLGLSSLLGSAALRRHLSALFGLMLAAALVAPTAAVGQATAPPRDGASPLAPGASYEQLIERYLRALDEVRGGSRSAEARLLEIASELEDRFQREDAVHVARFYTGLDPAARREGRRLEDRFDLLRTRAQEADTSDTRPGDALVQDLRLLLAEARQAADVTAAARTAALLARIEVREVERAWSDAVGRAALTEQADEHAELAIRGFAKAGQRTPQLEALWVRARVALARGELLGAERAFRDLADLAEGVRQPRWRERALLGLVGVSRESGAPFAASAALEELATFRHPAHCWALTRELAAQRLSEDHPDRALELLESFPPSGLDPEIDLAQAASEWRALQAAALVRAGDLDRAEAALEQARRAPGDDRAGLLDLTEAALLLDRGDPAAALELLATHPKSVAEGELDRVEVLALRGRALLAMGRTAEAMLPLQQAFDEARIRDATRWRHAEGELRDASAVGEWLGLTTVELLARARAATGQPLLAAATIEAAHAACTLEQARVRVLALAARQDLGALTWIVGADQSLVVHVRPDGSAKAEEIPRGRQELIRARDRLKQALLAARGRASGAPRGGTRGPLDSRTASLAQELSLALLPGSLDRALDDWARRAPAPPAPSVALLPHGALEGVCFELLTAGSPARTLGYDTALTIVDQLRDEQTLPPAIDGRTARWIALGAPEDTAAPELKWARRELLDLERLHPGFETVTGRAFDAERLLEALGGDRPVHVATHALRRGDRSEIAPLGLLASADELVSAAALAAVAPRLPLLVLATCDSAAGRSMDGLSTRGLAQAALDSGTRASVVTGWPLSDRHGRSASIAFHGALRKGSSPAEALRRARCALAAAGAPLADSAALRLLGTP